MVVSDGDAMLELGVVVEQVHNLETARCRRTKQIRLQRSQRS
jgi:hypothetical protein